MIDSLSKYFNISVWIISSMSIHDRDPGEQHTLNPSKIYQIPHVTPQKKGSMNLHNLPVDLFEVRRYAFY